MTTSRPLPRKLLSPRSEQILATRYAGQVRAVVIERALERLADPPERAELLERLNHLIDRVERGVALPEEVVQLRLGVRALAGVGSYRAAADSRSGPEGGAVRPVEASAGAPGSRAASEP